MARVRRSAQAAPQDALRLRKPSNKDAVHGRVFNAAPPEVKNQNGALSEYFGLAPFSVLSARSGWWQNRKRAWIDLGIKSEVGRGENLLNFSDTVSFTGEKYNAMKEQRARANKSASFRDQDKLNALRAKPNGDAREVERAARKIYPGQGQDIMLMSKRAKETLGSTAGARPSAKNIYKFKTADGYKSGAEVTQALGQSASIKDGKTFGLSIHAYDGGDPQTVASATGTSIFDPVLCEVAYRWFCPPGGSVLDPFAGGSVRGIVASYLERDYFGVDLSARQVEANRAQVRLGPRPRWNVGDSRELDKIAGSRKFDFVFSCPPYADLEVYSDDPRDLSTLSYEKFREDYAEIIRGACERLRDDRFACFVVGDVRDDRGDYRAFVSHTIEAFLGAGLTLYNYIVLVTAAGSLPLRVGRQFRAKRKVGKTHQDVLVFLKGDAARATRAVGEVEFGEISTLDQGAAPEPMGDQIDLLASG